ncbi:formylglycine-generating enzyme family protein [Aquamicrobium zhengzhouense]|nr:formylglycine-generating enzyme family protein [Aquamicrobium zhengzhouense]
MDQSAPIGEALAGMVWIPGGEFNMGCEHFYPEEKPVRTASVKGFWMDETPVTNRQFAQFVKETGYVTAAEAAEVPTTAVFRKLRGEVSLDDPRAWWSLEKASWRHPRGIKSDITRLALHPVVQITYEDALAFCAWSNTQLPTEEEWEFAARGGLDGAIFAWGNRERDAKNRPLANTWQGHFPTLNSREDGYEYTSPVKAFPANGYGLFDIVGNVWELTSTIEGGAGCCGLSNSTETKVVLKGGSHLCAPNYCFRYRPAARSSQTIDFATSHIGFRRIFRPK